MCVHVCLFCIASNGYMYTLQASEYGAIIYLANVLYVGSIVDKFGGYFSLTIKEDNGRPLRDLERRSGLSLLL